MSKIKIDRDQIESVFNHYPKEDKLYVTSDGNVFLTSGTGKNFCKDHCKRMNESFELLTREAFESGVEELPVVGDNLDTEGEGDSTDAGSTDWKTFKWDEMVAFANKEGLEPQTKMTQGKNALIEEIEAFIASKAIGANNTTNHTEQ